MNQKDSKFAVFLIGFLALFSPGFVSAQFNSVTGLLYKINKVVLNPVIILLFFLALLVFFWGIFQFIYKMDDDAGRQTGKDAIMYGLIGMLIMFSVYGIIHLILGSFGIDVPQSLQ